MTIVIIGAMPEEIERIGASLSNKQRAPIDAFDVYQGDMHGHAVVLAQSRVGKVNAAATATLLIERYQPQALISLGSAGGLHPELRIGDIVVSTALSYHDVDNRIWQYAFGQVPKMPVQYAADADLLSQTQAAFQEDTHTLRAGLITSADSFIADPDKVVEILSHFPDVYAVDMESAALAQVCYLFDVPFVSIRAITDTADHQAAALHNDAHLHLASQRSADLVLALLRSKKSGHQ